MLNHTKPTSQIGRHIAQRKRVASIGATFTLIAIAAAIMARGADVPLGFRNIPNREAYFGDLHLHTSYSLDAYFFMGATSVDPDEAYRFAKGEAVQYLGETVRRREPLDFLAITDHSELLGVLNTLEDPNSALSRSEIAEELRKRNPQALRELREWQPKIRPRSGVDPKSVTQSAWQRTIDAANRHYEPGKFTTFIAYEWTSAPSEENLHRNVIFKGPSAPSPFTASDSVRPEDLWTWIDKIRKQGYEALAIPHNSNASNGMMYDWVDSDRKTIERSYARRRQAHEPLSEIAQTKGASETHPLLSPTDEFANYEIFDFGAQWRGQDSRPQGSYLRDALGRGLILQSKLGINPYKFGFVGASDLHSGLTVSAQADYHGDISRVSLGGGIPIKERAAGLLSNSRESAFIPPLKTTSGNLTGVWADSNTRNSIFDALRRREVFATSGTKLKVRFFGGWDFNEHLWEEKNWVAAAYAGGVPMGGDLVAKPKDAEAPSFVIWAIKDPNGANLDRVQVIKVWEERGLQREKIFDAVWAGRRTPDPATGKVSAIDDTVDLKTGNYASDTGAIELKGIWKDAEFSALQPAAYYLRVLEIPTPRWSTLLAIRSGLPLPNGVPATLQQRGWSSPIWFTPHEN